MFHLRAPLMAACLLALAFPAAARTLMVGPDQAYPAPSAAAAAARDGDVVRIAKGEYFDCAIWRANNLTIEGAGPEATVITDKTCQGKGLFVITGNDVTVRNMTLARARVPDNNGAGIRHEGGGLTVEGVRFINDQAGILGGRKGSTTIVRDSVFINNGNCIGACAHAIYSGELGLLRVERSRFLGTKQGHHIKSRSFRTEVIECDIQDGPEGTASYLIDISNGGALVVRGSTLVKGPNAENRSAAIVIGAEGVTHPTEEITVENNSFRNDGDYATVFVRNVTATEARLVNNRISGKVKPLQGDGSVR